MRCKIFRVVMSCLEMSLGDRFCVSTKGETGGGGWVHLKSANSMEMQQNGVQSVKAMVKNGFVISLSTIMKIPLKVKVSGCMGNTHTICNQSTFLSGSKELKLVSKK